MPHERFRIKRTPEGGVSLGYSMLSCFQNCPRLFWWQYATGGVGIQPSGVGPPDDKLLYGKLWHAAYHGRLLDRSDRVSLLDALAEDQLLDHPFLAEIPMDLDWYSRQYKDMKVKVLSCEQELAIRVGKHEIRGTPDLIAELETDWGGGTYVIDHKTWVALSSDGKVYTKPHGMAFARNTHSRQFPFYMGLWNALNPGANCTQGIVNLVPQRITAIEERLAARTKGNKLAPEIAREFVFCHADFIGEVLEEAFYSCEQIAERLGSIGSGADEYPETHWGGNNKQCVSQFGTCAYLPLCESSKDGRAGLLANLYVPRTFTSSSEDLDG